MRSLTFSTALLIAVFSFANAALEFYVKPTEHSGPIGKNYTFTCRLKPETGPAPMLIWKKGDAKIDNEAGQFVVVFTQDQTEGSAESMLTILNAEEMDSGSYDCVHDNGNAGKFTGVLDVFQELVPSIDGDTVLREGEDINLVCSVEGSTTTTISWEKDGQALPESGFADLNGDNKNDVEVKANNTLVIMEAAQEDAGVYSCIHTVGEREFVANATVGEELQLEGPKSVKYTEGERARFECTVTGSPKPTITWSRENGTIDEDRAKYDWKEKGTHVKTYTSTYTLIGVKMSDRGNYICTADNKVGEPQTHAILLRVRDRLAALWPFIGIMCEVIILIAIIFIHEKCTQGGDVGEDDEDDEAMEPIKGAPDEKATSDGEGDVRMRATKE